VCEESGTDLAQLVRKKVKVQQKQAATSQASTSALASLSHSSDIHVVQPMPDMDEVTRITNIGRAAGFVPARLSSLII
jgi:hypothetical protein